jgi:hypothetical protein
VVSKAASKVQQRPRLQQHDRFLIIRERSQRTGNNNNLLKNQYKKRVEPKTGSGERGQRQFLGSLVGVLTTNFINYYVIFKQLETRDNERATRPTSPQQLAAV